VYFKHLWGEGSVIYSFFYNLILYLRLVHCVVWCVLVYSNLMNQSNCKQTLFGEIVNKNLRNRIEIKIKFNELKENLIFLNLIKK